MSVAETREYFRKNYGYIMDDFAERADFFEGAIDQYGATYGQRKEAIEVAQNLFMDMVKHAEANPEYKKELHKYISFDDQYKTLKLRELSKAAGHDYGAALNSNNLEIVNAVDLIDSAHLHANDTCCS